MAQPMSDGAQQRADYIAAMMESFEHENPGIAELLAISDDAMRRYADASKASHNPVMRTSSSHS